MREVTITLRLAVTCQLSKSVVLPHLRNVVNVGGPNMVRTFQRATRVSLAFWIGGLGEGICGNVANAISRHQFVDEPKPRARCA